MNEGPQRGVRVRADGWGRFVLRVRVCACVCVLHVRNRQEQDMWNTGTQPALSETKFQWSWIGRPKAPVQPVVPVLVTFWTVLTVFVNCEREQMPPTEHSGSLSEDQQFLFKIWSERESICSEEWRPNNFPPDLTCLVAVVPFHFSIA